MSDRHYYEGLPPRHLHRTCKHCGRPFKGRYGAKFGSNACRQAWYRAKANTDLASKMAELRRELFQPAATVPKQLRLRKARKGGAA